MNRPHKMIAIILIVLIVPPLFSLVFREAVHPNTLRKDRNRNTCHMAGSPGAAAGAAQRDPREDHAGQPKHNG
ncbi:hypothetical protein J31TS4_12210 [Paenibacillus sp. J31TS4]|nr:hypothetical protein J31TS4_12210 [Paenibacillus sp. J31TS4]